MLLIQSSTAGLVKTEIFKLAPFVSMKGRLDLEELKEVQSQQKCLLGHNK